MMTPFVYLISAMQLAAPPDEVQPVVRATLVEKAVYSSGIADDGPDDWRTTGSGKLWLLQTDLASGKAIVAHDVMRTTSIRPDGLLRWQLDKGRYSFATYGGHA